MPLVLSTQALGLWDQCFYFSQSPDPPNFWTNNIIKELLPCSLQLWDGSSGKPLVKFEGPPWQWISLFNISAKSGHLLAIFSDNAWVNLIGTSFTQACIVTTCICMGVRTGGAGGAIPPPLFWKNECFQYTSIDSPPHFSSKHACRHREGFGG